MRKTLVLLSVLGLLLIYYGCGKTGLIGSNLLTDEMKGQIPFQGGEKVHFLSDSGDQIVFEAWPRKNDIHEVPDGDRTNRYYHVEVDKLIFYDTLSNNFGFQLGGWISGVPEGVFRLRYENTGIEYHYDAPLTTEKDPYVDSIFIMNQWHYNVFVFEHENMDTTNLKVFYSTQYGMLKVDFADGSTWELEKIEW